VQRHGRESRARRTYIAFDLPVGSGVRPAPSTLGTGRPPSKCATPSFFYGRRSIPVVSTAIAGGNLLGIRPSGAPASLECGLLGGPAWVGRRNQTGQPKQSCNTHAVRNRD